MNPRQDATTKQLLFIPGPVTVSPAVLAAMARPLIDHRGPEYAALLGRLARGMQPIFGTKSDVVFLGSSGTGGLEAAVASMFSPGQRLLACPVGVFGKRFIEIAMSHALEVEVLQTPLGHRLDPAQLTARLRSSPRPFDGILLTHNETSTGVQNDMAALAQAIGDYPAAVIVDSVSGLAASAFEMDAWGFDVVVGATQKALAAPPGMAMVAVSARAWQRMARAVGSRFYLDLRKAREFAAHGQTPWTPPVSIAIALDVAIERYLAESPAGVWSRHARYGQAIRAAMAAIGVDVFSQPDAHSVTVVAMHAPPGIDVASVSAALREQHGIIIGGGQAELKGKILRMGTMGDLTPGDIIGALAALETVLREHGHRSQSGAGVSAALEIFNRKRLPEPAFFG